ncbi:MAG: NAD(P)-dependent oxidoreductase [Pseudomonadota bacterium]
MSGETATVLGAGGFVGRAVADVLRRRGLTVRTPTRAEVEAGRIFEIDLGHVVYAIGLTGNFRTRPLDTMEAHVSLLGNVLHRADWESFLVLSSTRVYGAARAGYAAREEDAVSLTPSADSLYDLSKLCGEALALAHPKASARVVRLSNVFGDGMNPSTFLAAVVHEARQKGKVLIGEAPGSSKDYVPLADAAEQIADVALRGSARLYNVASGVAVSHAQIADVLRRAGAKVDFAADGPERRLAEIDVSRYRQEFEGKPIDVHDALARFITQA